MKQRAYSKGAVVLGPAALRQQCATATLELERAAEDSITRVLTQGVMPPAESLLRAVETAERYEAAAMKMRKWSGRFK